MIGRVYRWRGGHWIIRVRGEPFDRGPRRNVLLERVVPWMGVGWGDQWFKCVDGQYWRPMGADEWQSCILVPHLLNAAGDIDEAQRRVLARREDNEQRAARTLREFLTHTLGPPGWLVVRPFRGLRRSVPA